MPKFIFITGGVLSGLGKGVVTASIAKLLQLCNLKVTCVKIDPYLNVDAGTMNPLVHGEVFVTEDGGETDMDIGTYERFLDQNLTLKHNITTGQIYFTVIQRERRGDYLGKCVQIIPHITDEVKSKIYTLANSNLDVIIIECGGTVGDIESLPFLEAFRQMRLELGSRNSLFIHVTLAPILEGVGEQKTKPTQHSVQELRRIGIQPDIIVVRCVEPLKRETKDKIALFTSVEWDCVISDHDVDNIYSVPLLMYEESILNPIGRKLDLSLDVGENLKKWEEISQTFTHAKEEVKIAMVGKYVKLTDSYVSVNHALLHASAYLGVKPKLNWIDSEKFETNSSELKLLDEYHGILIPGGFGKRGSEGKIIVANYARENKIPFLGLCFGFQLGIVSFARFVCNLKDANSTELDPDTPHPVIDLLPEQRNTKEMGATMRLGSHKIEIVKDTRAYKIYGKEEIYQRHRHRYELNPLYKDRLEAEGLIFSGFSDEGRRAEIFELKDHPFYMATQYHPEFISRPGKPEPIFLEFVKACLMGKNL
ncbi:MAG: CTP synthase (glutamine hydrolyzing) [Nitrososphaerales archaeon]